MARHQADREDLMSEATALRRRIELALPGEIDHVVAGIRDDGRWSIYFGSDPVFHFDADGSLRRAFVAGDLYRSQVRTLARLTRTRTGESVELVRHDLDATELERFLQAMQERLDRLRAALDKGPAQVIRQIPGDADLASKLIAGIASAREGRLSASIKKR